MCRYHFKHLNCKKKKKVFKPLDKIQVELMEHFDVLIVIFLHSNIHLLLSINEFSLLNKYFPYFSRKILIFSTSLWNDTWGVLHNSIFNVNHCQEVHFGSGFCWYDAIGSWWREYFLARKGFPPWSKASNVYNLRIEHNLNQETKCKCMKNMSAGTVRNGKSHKC